LPRCVEQAVATSGTIRSPRLDDPDRYHSHLLETIHTVGPAVFDGLSDEEITVCTARSSLIIACAQGDRILRQGGAARNLYVVLDGTLEVRDQAHQVAVLGPGDVFGETAFLLRCPRTYHVDATADRTRLLAISERTLRDLATDCPTAGAKFFANLATVLSSRLVSDR
jgi:CRP-like cAMP-binding protein